MLKLENIRKTFNPGTVNEKRAIDGISLHLKPGDFASIVGSNGAGKSTLLNAVAGSFYVDEGSIVLDGNDITFAPEYRVEQRGFPRSGVREPQEPGDRTSVPGPAERNRSPYDH